MVNHISNIPTGADIVLKMNERFFSGQKWTYKYNGIGSTTITQLTKNNTVSTTGPGIDCNAFVQQSLLNSGFNVQRIPTTGYTVSTEKYVNGVKITTAVYHPGMIDIVNGTLSTQYAVVVSPTNYAINDVQVGDVLVFNGVEGGHTGLVTYYDPVTRLGKFSNAQGSNAGVVPDVWFTTDPSAKQGLIPGTSNILYWGAAPTKDPNHYTGNPPTREALVGVLRVQPGTYNPDAAAAILNSINQKVDAGRVAAGLEPVFSQTPPAPVANSDGSLTTPFSDGSTSTSYENPADKSTTVTTRSADGTVESVSITTSVLGSNGQPIGYTVTARNPIDGSSYDSTLLADGTLVSQTEYIGNTAVTTFYPSGVKINTDLAAGGIAPVATITDGASFGTGAPGSTPSDAGLHFVEFSSPVMSGRVYDNGVTYIQDSQTNKQQWSIPTDTGGVITTTQHPNGQVTSVQYNLDPVTGGYTLEGSPANVQQFLQQQTLTLPASGLTPAEQQAWQTGYQTVNDALTNDSNATVNIAADGSITVAAGGNTYGVTEGATYQYAINSSGQLVGISFLSGPSAGQTFTYSTDANLVLTDSQAATITQQMLSNFNNTGNPIDTTGSLIPAGFDGVLHATIVQTGGITPIAEITFQVNTNGGVPNGVTTTYYYPGTGDIVQTVDTTTDWYKRLGAVVGNDGFFDVRSIA